MHEGKGMGEYPVQGMIAAEKELAGSQLPANDELIPKNNGKLVRGKLRQSR